MTRQLPPVLGLCLFLIAAAFSVDAADGNAGDARLRDALRDSITQLRSAQAELANMQASQGALTEEKKNLGEKYEALKKQASADQAAKDKTLSGLTTQLNEEKVEVARLKEALEKSKGTCLKAEELSRTTEAQRAKLVLENNALQRKVADRESKNVTLFLIGNEILERYADFSLGKALAAKEPFVGLTRVKLENLIQDYQDKLLDQRVKL